MTANKAISIIVIILLIIILAGIVVIALLWTGKLKNFMWKEGPRNTYHNLVDKLGGPNYISYSSGGFAVWNKKDPFHSVILDDEDNISHCCPAIHNDFLTCSIRVDIDDPLRMIAVLSISKSIWYDQLKHLLYARCDFLGANVATFLLATDMILMKDADLLELWKNTATVQAQYKQMIMDTKNDSGYNKALSRLKSNLKNLKGTAPKSCGGKIDCSTVLDYGSFQRIDPQLSHMVGTVSQLHPRLNQIGSGVSMSPSVPSNTFKRANQCFACNQPNTFPKPNYGWDV